MESISTGGFATPLFTGATGCWLIDREGTRFFDGTAGSGAISLGHQAPEVLEAARAQIDRLVHTGCKIGSDVRHETTLLVTAMQCLELDHVLVMGRQAAQPWRSAPVLRPRGTNLADYAQSTYQLAPYLGALRYLLEERPDSCVVMVGLACHVQGMRKLQAMDTRIGAWARANVGFMVEIACSSGTTPAGTESMITETLGLELSQVIELRYREGEYPVQMQVKTRDGTTHLRTPEERRARGLIKEEP